MSEGRWQAYRKEGRITSVSVPRKDGIAVGTHLRILFEEAATYKL